MENKKLTLEDLKLESFLTEIDNSKLVKVQGGNGAYDETEGGCGSEIDDCNPDETNDCGDQSKDCDTEENYCGSNISDCPL